MTEEQVKKSLLMDAIPEDTKDNLLIQEYQFTNEILRVYPPSREHVQEKLDEVLFNEIKRRIRWEDSRSMDNITHIKRELFLFTRKELIRLIKVIKDEKD